MPLKTTLSNTLRSLRLLRAADHARFLVTRLRRRRRNRAFVDAHPDVAFPPPYWLYETYTLDYGEYLCDGREVAEWVYEHVGDALPATPTILDWGCGPARVTRHLPEVFPGATVYGVDYNASYVRWCAENLPDIDFRPCTLLPPLPIDDGTLDLVVGLSVFTHLSAEAHEAWTAELGRVLRHGGMAFVTTMGDAYRAQLGDAQRAQYDQGKLVTKGATEEGHRTYVAHQPPGYFRTLVGQLFDVTEHVGGGVES